LPVERRSPLRLASALALALALLAAPALTRAVTAGAPTVSPEQVQAALERLRKDPNLGGSKTEKTLRFKDSAKKSEQKPPANENLDWLVQLLQWVTESARLLVWFVGALAVALLAVGLRRWWRAYAPQSLPRGTLLPSHVQDLDIRPASLPDDIGAAAAALWQRALYRPALSLLYRGALSRLVHGHAVPIRAASTEGECLRLAQSRLDPVRGSFLAQLVGSWQLAVYGQRLPDAAVVLTLCREFEQQLGPALPLGSGP
jgi:hypothetical protein